MQINIEKKHFYGILGFIILITSGVIIYANVDTTGAWHDADSIQITINGVQMSLQQAIENGNLSGGSEIDLSNYATISYVDNNDANTNAQTICPRNEFLDGDGDCRTADNIVTNGASSATLSNCEWSPIANPAVCPEGKVATRANLRFGAGYHLRLYCCSIS